MIFTKTIIRFIFSPGRTGLIQIPILRHFWTSSAILGWSHWAILEFDAQDFFFYSERNQGLVKED